MTYDIIIIGGGKAGCAAGLKVLEAGLSCAMVSAGISLNEDGGRNAFIARGGVLYAGDTVTGAECDGARVTALATAKLGGAALRAKAFILASGKYFAGGLRSDMEKVFEPVFGLDVDFLPDRSGWYNDIFFAPQPFEKFGVRTSSDGRALKGGAPLDNVWPAGEILAGTPDIIESAEQAAESAIAYAGK